MHVRAHRKSRKHGGTRSNRDTLQNGHRFHLFQVNIAAVKQASRPSLQPSLLPMPKFSLPGWIRLTSRWHGSKKRSPVGKMNLSLFLFIHLPRSFVLIGAWTRTNSEQMFNFDSDECVFHFSISSFLLPAIGVFRIYLCKWNEHMPGCVIRICKVTKPLYFRTLIFGLKPTYVERFSLTFDSRNREMITSFFPFGHDCVIFAISKISFHFFL